MRPLLTIAQSPKVQLFSPLEAVAAVFQVTDDIECDPSPEFVFERRHLPLPGGVTQDPDFQRWLEYSRDSSFIATLSVNGLPLSLEGVKPGSLIDRGVKQSHAHKYLLLRRLLTLKRIPLALSDQEGAKTLITVKMAKSLLQLAALPPMTRVAPEQGGPSDMPGGPGDFNDEKAAGHLASGASMMQVQFLNREREREHPVQGTTNNGSHQDTVYTVAKKAPHYLLLR